jgi:hydrogenase maturation protease
MMARKLVSLVCLVVGCGGIGLFVALSVYVWSLKTEVNQQTETLAVKAHKAGDEADRAVAFVRDVIAQAGRDLEYTRRQTQPRPRKPISVFEMALAQSASKRLAGSVDRAHGAVVTASDAVVVAEAALRVFNKSEELQQLFGIQPSQFDATKTTLDKASSELRQAQSALGGPPTPEQLNAVDNALDQAEGFTNEMSRVVEIARARVDTTRANVDRWSWRITIATTVVSALAAVGQFFMARYFWRTLRGLPA